MRYFKDSGDGYYAVGDGFEPPDDWQSITEQEWSAANPPVMAAPAEQIETLERDTLLPRPVRDFMLLSMEQAAVQQGAAQGLSPAQSVAALRAKNSGYRKVKELDEQISALRALL